MQDAANRQCFGGKYKCSREAAVTRLALAMVNTRIFSLPRERHGCRHSISVVLPLIHKCSSARQPLCDKVPCAPVRLKTHKVGPSTFLCCSSRGHVLCVPTRRFLSDLSYLSPSTKVDHHGHQGHHDAWESRRRWRGNCSIPQHVLTRVTKVCDCRHIHI